MVVISNIGTPIREDKRFNSIIMEDDDRIHLIDTMPKRKAKTTVCGLVVKTAWSPDNRERDDFEYCKACLASRRETLNAESFARRRKYALQAGDLIIINSGTYKKVAEEIVKLVSEATDPLADVMVIERSSGIGATRQMNIGGWRFLNLYKRARTIDADDTRPRLEIVYDQPAVAPLPLPSPNNGRPKSARTKDQQIKAALNNLTAFEDRAPQDRFKYNEGRFARCPYCGTPYFDNRGSGDTLIDEECNCFLCEGDGELARWREDELVTLMEQASDQGDYPTLLRIANAVDPRHWITWEARRRCGQITQAQMRQQAETAGDEDDPVLTF